MKGKFKLDWIEDAGWIGMCLILTAYGCASFNLISVHSFAYQVLNLLGSISLVAVAWRKRDLQPAALNLIWCLIAVVSLIQLVVIR